MAGGRPARRRGAPADGADIVSGAEIGRRLGVSRERVRQWASDAKYGFPRSLGRRGTARLWRWSEVVEWARRRGRAPRAP